MPRYKVLFDVLRLWLVSSNWEEEATFEQLSNFKIIPRKVAMMKHKKRERIAARLTLYISRRRPFSYFFYLCFFMTPISPFLFFSFRVKCLVGVAC